MFDIVLYKGLLAKIKENILDYFSLNHNVLPSIDYSTLSITALSHGPMYYNKHVMTILDQLLCGVRTLDFTQRFRLEYLLIIVVTS